MSTVETATRKRPRTLAALLAVLALALPTYTVASAASADEASSWTTLSPSKTSEGDTKITFDGGMGWGAVTQGATWHTRYADLTSGGVTVTLPTFEEMGQPQNYKDANGNPNYYLAGWGLVPGGGQEGSPLPVQTFEPGQTVTVDSSFLNDRGEVLFVADWRPMSYDYGSAGDAQLGGLKEGMFETEAIRTRLYDISTPIFNLQHMRYGSNGSWADNHSGPLFIDGDAAGFDTLFRPREMWMVNPNPAEPNYAVYVNRWNGGPGAAQGLWDYMGMGQMFSESTPGVNYVGDAHNGGLFYVEDQDVATGGGRNLKGYYVYNSDQHAAAYNQSESRFYVYNEPQDVGGTTGVKGFFPLNNATDGVYSVNAGQVNYHYTMVTDIDFFLTGNVGDPGANQIEVDGQMKDMEFYFSGDDDVYVFVDDQLVLDIGGNHSRTEGSINFATGEVRTLRQNGWKNYEESVSYDAIAGLGQGNHRLTVYYAERGANEANNLTAFLLTLPTTLQIQKLETQTGEPVAYPGAQFYLQNEVGQYYRLDEPLLGDPLSVPRVSYVDDPSQATLLEVDADGIVTARYITDGNYVLTEVGAPENYDGLPGSFGFNVKNSKIVPSSLTFYPDNVYSAEKQPYTENPDWAANVEVQDDQVTLHVSNDRSTHPLQLSKSFSDGKAPEGVPFKVYEATPGDATATEAVPADARLVYEGVSKADGSVGDFTWYPLGKENTPADKAVTGLNQLDIKEGSVYYIVEDYYDSHYYRISRPVVVVADESGVRMVTDSAGDGFVFDGTQALAWTPADAEDPAKLAVTNVRIPVDNPDKKVNGAADTVDGEGARIADVFLDLRDQEFEYTVSQKVPAQAAKIGFADTLEAVLEVVGTPTVSVDGQSLDAAVNVDGQNVTAAYGDGSSELTGLVGKTVTLTIKAKLRAALPDGTVVDDAYLIEHYGTAREIPNTAEVTINNDSQTTNEVLVTPPPEPKYGNLEIRKTQKGDGAKKEFTFEVAFADAEGAAVDAAGISTLTVAGEPVEAGKNGARIENGKLVVVVKGGAKVLIGGIPAGTTDDPKGYTYAVTERFAPGFDQTSATGAEGEIKDGQTAKASFVNEPVPSDEPEKKVNGKTAYTLDERPEAFIYTISQKVPAKAGKIAFSDTLEDVLEVVGTPVVTVEGSEQPLAAEVKVAEANGAQSVTATYGDSTKELTDVIGKTVTLTIQAKIRDSVTDDELVAKYGKAMEIPNKATVAINDEGQPTNEVVVNPPSEPVKKVNGATNTAETPVELEGRYDEFTYTIDKLIPFNAVNVVFTDELEDVLEVVGTPTLSALDGVVKVEGQKVTGTIADATALAGQTVTLTIVARIKDGVSDAELEAAGYVNRAIPNKATVEVDAKGEVTNEVFVTPPPDPREDPEKTVNGQKGLVNLAKRSEVFTYTVTQKMPMSATEATFEDVLEDVLEVVGEPSIKGKASYEVKAEEVDGHWVVTAASKNVRKDRGKTVTLTFQAKIRAGVSDEELIAKYGTTVVPNEADVTIDNDSRTTNVVEVTPPNPPREDPQKAVNGKQNTAATPEQVERPESFTYSVSQKLPANVKTASFEDTLDKVLEFADPLSFRIEANGVEIPGVTPVIDGQKLSVELDAEAYDEQTLVIYFDAKIRDVLADGTVVDDAYLVANYGAERSIPNQAKVVLDGKGQGTNTVYVTPPPEPGEDPEKTVNGQKDPLALDARDEVFTYKVTQKIPAKASKAEFVDTLEDVLEIVGTPALDAEGGQVAVDGQKVTATLEGEALKAQWTKTVTLTIQAKIRAEVTDAQLLARYGTLNVPNKAEVAIDGAGKATNEVLVTPPPEPREDPVKKVNGQKGRVKLTARDEVFTYTVEQKIPANAVSAEFTDTLEDVLEIVGTPTLDAEGGQVAVDGQKVTATLEGEALKAQWTKTVTLTIQAKIRAEVTDAELLARYGTIDVPNRAKVAIDGKGKATNKVLVTPPPSEEEPTKKVNGQTAPVALEARNEEFTYTVEQYIPYGAAAAEFTDTLEDVLEIVGEPTLDADGADIKVEGQKVAAKLEGDALKAAWTKTVTLTIKAKIKDGVTDSELLARYGTINVPNKAEVAIDGKGKATNEVLVTPPPNEDKPVKKVNASTKTAKLAARDEVFTYTVEQYIPYGATAAEFTDTLEDVLEIVETPALDAEGGQVSVNGQTVTATLEGDKLKSAWTTTVTLTIKAKIRAEVTDAELLARYGTINVPNKAKVAIDGKGKATNNVLVTPPPSEEEPVKKVNGQTAPVALDARDEVFTYTVEQYIPANAKKAEFTDTLEDVLEIVGEPTLDADGADIKVEGQTVTATLEGGALKAQWTKTVTLTIKAKIRAEVTDAQLLRTYGTLNVPNKAEVAIDGKGKATNEVLVTPPPTPREDPKKTVSKSRLDARDEVFTYTVEQVIPAGATTAEFVDTLEDVLEIVGTPALDVEGGQVAVDGQTVTAKLEGEALEPMWEKAVTLTIKAKIRDGVTDSELLARYGTIDVPNKAEVAIDGEGKATNEVIVTPPPSEDKPVKKVNASTKTAKLAARDEVFTYTVEQYIPYGATAAEYADTLEDVLEIVGTPALDAEGGQVSVDGQTVTATLEGEALKAQWTKTVTLTIQAKIRDGVTDAELLAKYGTINVPNKAKVAIDGKGKATNTVRVTPPPSTDKPEKKVNDAQKAELSVRSEEFTYTVAQYIPYGATTAEFVDTLEDVLEIVGEPTVDAEGGQVAVEGQKVTATLEGEALKAQWTKTVTLTIKAKVRAEVTDSELIARYGTLDVPNKAEVAIDGKGEATNEVVVTPPPLGSVRVEHVTEDGTILRDWEDVVTEVPEGTEYETTVREFPGYEFVKMHDDSAPANGEVVSGETLDVIYVYRPIETVPEKAINGQKDLVELKMRPEQFTYTVTQVIPGGAVNVVFSDTLEDVLEIVATPTIDAEGFEIAVDGQTVTATAADATALAGKAVTLTIEAKVRDSVKDAELVELYGIDRHIPNVATVTIDGTAKVTNEVLVVPPTPVRGEEVIPFHGTINKKMEMSLGTQVQGAKLRLTGEDGKVWAEWTTGAEPWHDYIAPGIYTLTEIEVPEGYKAADPITFTVTAEGKIVADSVFVDIATNTVTMVDEPVEPEIVKTVNGKEHADLTSAGETFVYDITAFVTGDAVSMRISDTLVDELEFVSDSAAVKVTVDGKQVEGAEVSIEGQNLSVSLADVKAIRGKFVAVSFEAKVREGADLSKYGEAGMEKVPNTASYTIVNEAGAEVTTESNTVTVTPPPTTRDVPPTPTPSATKTPTVPPTVSPATPPATDGPALTKPLSKTGVSTGTGIVLMMILLSGGIGVFLGRRRHEAA